ncbi:sll1863 family stress response protein [Methylovulum psychrotolerans]|uniref:Coiled coil domain-containing protein n=1 Tax=Methylovulum psychrotolerans TaxID=1704499 RepID=A0A1Z4C0S7_9GAMM|nr:hypothetical protein [Methylovulum psychrotolerans]ASF47111.1 hypothetical protein CEK71_14090 [Methylovulum psychrotolerans]MBT9100404.1 hypothetical protein [Methylovulum psychrotolerans]POZ51400.1 hypothetical protein AADEFJLK_02850 [Methylovulum psychrotolerans]
MKTKNDYIDSMAAELKAWGMQIDVLTAQAERSVGTAKLKYTQELNSLRGHQQAATLKMRDLETASDDTWENIKETADKVWDDLRTGLSSATANFK